MSYAYRNRLKECGLEKFKLEQEEWEFIWENIASFCIASDLKCKEKFGETANEEEIVEKMTEKEFIEFALETIRETMDRLGYKKRKSRKRQVVEDDNLEITSYVLLQEQSVSQRQTQAGKIPIDCGCDHHV